MLPHLFIAVVRFHFQITSIGVRNKAMGANMKLAEAMSTTTKTMNNMNTVFKPEQIAADMSNFSKVSMKMDMTDEMSKYDFLS